MDNRAIHKFEIVKHIGKLSYINNPRLFTDQP